MYYFITLLMERNSKNPVQKKGTSQNQFQIWPIWSKWWIAGPKVGNRKTRDGVRERDTIEAVSRRVKVWVWIMSERIQRKLDLQYWDKRDGSSPKMESPTQQSLRGDHVWAHSLSNVWPLCQIHPCWNLGDQKTRTFVRNGDVEQGKDCVFF